CRRAKEQLLADGDLASAPVVVLGRGSRVIGGSIKAELPRSDVEATLIDGFFPVCALSDRPARPRNLGLRELGLPFAADARDTCHLASFVAAHRLPTALLFNGGVMKATRLRERVADTVRGWIGSENGPKVLGGTDLDLAVAHGAAYFGLVRCGRGIRVRGGTA